MHEIAEACDLPPNQMSEHLRLLKGHGFLDSDRQARTVFLSHRQSKPARHHCMHQIKLWEEEIDRS